MTRQRSRRASRRCCRSPRRPCEDRTQCIPSWTRSTRSWPPCRLPTRRYVSVVMTVAWLVTSVFGWLLHNWVGYFTFWLVTSYFGWLLGILVGYFIFWLTTSYFSYLLFFFYSLVSSLHILVALLHILVTSFILILGERG